jgi:hypothetical protein
VWAASLLQIDPSHNIVMPITFSIKEFVTASGNLGFDHGAFARSVCALMFGLDSPAPFHLLIKHGYVLGTSTTGFFLIFRSTRRVAERQCYLGAAQKYSANVLAFQVPVCAPLKIMRESHDLTESL